MPIPSTDVRSDDVEYHQSVLALVGIIVKVGIIIKVGIIVNSVCYRRAQ